MTTKEEIYNKAPDRGIIKIEQWEQEEQKPQVFKNYIVGIDPGMSTGIAVGEWYYDHALKTFFLTLDKKHTGALKVYKTNKDFDDILNELHHPNVYINSVVYNIFASADPLIPRECYIEQQWTNLQGELAHLAMKLNLLYATIWAAFHNANFFVDCISPSYKKSMGLTTGNHYQNKQLMKEEVRKLLGEKEAFHLKTDHEADAIHLLYYQLKYIKTASLGINPNDVKVVITYGDNVIK
jgi:hypothetical protein